MRAPAGTGTRTFLYLVGIIAFIAAVGIFTVEQSAFHEQEALLCILIGVTSIGLGQIIEILLRGRGADASEQAPTAPMVPEPRKPMTPREKRRLAIAIGSVALLLIGGVIYGELQSHFDERAEQRRHHLDQLRSGPFVDATIASLRAGEHGGQIVRVSAKFSKSDRDDVFVDGGVCHYIGEQALTAGLKTGQPIVLHAEAAGPRDGLAQLDDCVIEPP